jgi:hypothetical protein
MSGARALVIARDNDGQLPILKRCSASTTTVSARWHGKSRARRAGPFAARRGNVRSFVR